MHLVRSKPPAAPAAPATSAPAPGAYRPAAAPGRFGVPVAPPSDSPPAGGMMGAAQSMMRNPEAMRRMMESPMVQSMMSNPDMLRSMAQSNPQLRELMERRPELSAALSDPETMRQAMRAAMDPRYAAELNSSTDRAMASLEAHPAGMRALQRMWNDVGEPLSSASLSGSRGSTEDADAAGAAPETPVADPLPNPWGPPAGPSTSAPAAARPGAMPWGVPRASTATSEARPLR